MSVVTVKFKLGDAEAYVSRQGIGMLPVQGDTANYVAILDALDRWAKRDCVQCESLKWDTVFVETKKFERTEVLPDEVTPDTASASSATKFQP